MAVSYTGYRRRDTKTPRRHVCVMLDLNLEMLLEAVPHDQVYERPSEEA